MPSHRSLRVAEAIREVVSSAILFEVSDPRVRAVTVLRAEVTGDLRNATVYVSIMGSDHDQEVALKGLQHAAGFLQSRVAARLQTRFTPILTFKRDDSVKKSIAMSRLIDEALASDHPAGDVAAADDDDPDHPDDDENDDELEDDDPRR
ncbi:MAG: 30S ribosome-binding factor RbfA [Isosphaeraceae bacterium]|nr:30S ribosome-binding factor RbfA [Isosphaeraceae bacterium]